MTIYMIRGETVTAHAAAPAKPPKGSLTIGSAGDIASSDLTAPPLVAIWNALPGAAPVTKFKDRKTAARRLWAGFRRIAPSPRRKSATVARTPAMTKQARVIEMLRRPAGATIDEIVNLTAWRRRASPLPAISSKLARIPWSLSSRAEGSPVLFMCAMLISLLIAFLAADYALRRYARPVVSQMP